MKLINCDDDASGNMSTAIFLWAIGLKQRLNIAVMSECY